MPESVSASERRVALIGIFLCMFLSALDQTIVATALPRIVQDLGGTALYAWVATSYLLASTVALPVAGRLADMVSPKYILIAASTIFLVGSALSGLSTGMDALIAFRALQGLGGGAIFAVAATVIGLLYPPRERGKLQGLFGAIFGIASVVGPYLGGLLTDSLSWRFVFYVNMPFGILALYVLLRHMPALTPPRRQRFDYAGIGTLLLWTVPLILGLSWGGSTYAWTSPEVLGLFALSLVALVAFYVLERHSAEPLFDLTLLRLPTFAWAGAGSLLFGAAFLGSILFLPLYLVMAKGISPEGSGLVLTPLTLGVVVGSFAAGTLASKWGRYKGLLLFGTAVATVLFAVLYALLRTDTPLPRLLAILVVLGIGLGPGFPIYTLAVQNAVRRQQMGVASSGNQFLRQIGSAMGAALMGAILVSTMKTQIAAHLPQAYRAAAASQAGSAGTSELESTSALRESVLAPFDRTAREVGAALRGNSAAFAALSRNSSIPAADRRALVPGGIPAEVRNHAARTLAEIRSAWAGNRSAVQTLRADRSLPGPARSLVARPPATPAARAAALREIGAGLRAAEPRTIASVERKVIPKVETKILAQGARAVASVESAVTDGVTAGVREVFGLAGVLSFGALVAGVFLPGVQLRHGLHPEDAAEWQAGEDAVDDREEPVGGGPALDPGPTV